MGAAGDRVFTLVVQVGRKAGDGLPEGATGAGLLCYAPARDEPAAVRDAVDLLKKSGFAVLEVEGLGCVEDRRAAGLAPEPEELELMARAAADQALVLAQVTPFFGGDETGGAG